MIVPESIKAEITKAPITPRKTRWNSSYDSVEQLFQNIEKLDKFFEIAGVPALKTQEKEFLRAYREAM